MSFGAWIKLEKDLLTDPRVLNIARGLRDLYPSLSRHAAVTLTLGALAQLWILADKHVMQEDLLALGIDEINHVIGIEGFCQLIPQDWLQIIDANNVKFPNYHTHNGTLAKRRALGQRRSQRYRKTHHAQASHSGNARVTQTASLDQDLDHISKTTPLPPTDLDPKAWAAWIDYRRKIGKTLRPVSQAVAQAQLARFGKDQMAVVNQSIANGYTGLFQLKANGGAIVAAKNSHSVPPSAEWAELRAHGKAIGFREPWPQESVGAYRTDLAMWEQTPLSRRPLSAALGDLKAKLTT
jgi:hypothetical protein